MDGSDPQQFVDEPKYIDGRPPEQEVSAKEAPADLTRYRKDVAAKLLQELTGKQTAQPQPEVAPTPEPDQFTDRGCRRSTADSAALGKRRSRRPATIKTYKGKRITK